MIVETLVVLCAIFHFGFLVLEMYLWTKPAGLRLFRQTLEQARASSTLAANQGLYNGILAAGLLWTLTIQPKEWSIQAQTFFFSSIVVAGVYGSLTVSRRIFWLQSFPAILGLAAIFALH